MKSITLIAGVLMLFAQPLVGAQAAEDVAMPPEAALCDSCHGPQGQGLEPLGPRIAGLSSQYIQKQIKLFQSGARQNATMVPMAMALQGDEVIAQVATYFAAQPVADAKPRLRGEQVVFDNPAEKLVYQGDGSRDLPACVTCHGPSGSGGGPFPRLAGQHASYIKTQLHAWQQGTRTGDANGVMAHIANQLSASEIDAIADYFANLK